MSLFEFFFLSSLASHIECIGYRERKEKPEKKTKTKIDSQEIVLSRSLV